MPRGRGAVPRSAAHDMADSDRAWYHRGRSMLDVPENRNEGEPSRKHYGSDDAPSAAGEAVKRGNLATTPLTLSPAACSYSRQERSDSVALDMPADLHAGFREYWRVNYRRKRPNLGVTVACKITSVELVN